MLHVGICGQWLCSHGGSTCPLIFRNCALHRIFLGEFVSQFKSRYGGVSGTHIYADKWYTSVGQAERCIKVHKVHYTGTMKNGLVPTQCKQDPRTKRMRRGQSYSWSNSTCSLVIWKDSAKIFTISTAHDGRQTVPDTSAEPCTLPRVHGEDGRD